MHGIRRWREKECIGTTYIPIQVKVLSDRARRRASTHVYARRRAYSVNTRFTVNALDSAASTRVDHRDVEYVEDW
jgi:hypothetical protein